MDNNRTLRIGDRVQMSAFGLSRHPKYIERKGKIVGRGTSNSWRVKFDDRICPQLIFKDYLERIARHPPASGGTEARGSDLCAPAQP